MRTITLRELENDPHSYGEDVYYFRDFVGMTVTSDDGSTTCIRWSLGDLDPSRLRIVMRIRNLPEWKITVPDEFHREKSSGAGIQLSTGSITRDRARLTVLEGKK